MRALSQCLQNQNELIADQNGHIAAFNGVARARPVYVAEQITNLVAKCPLGH